MMVKNFDPEVIGKTNAIMTRAMNGVLAEQGFVDFPHRVGVDRGKTSYGSYAYQRARLDGDLLTFLMPYVKAKGGYILVELNVVRLNPAPRELSEMKEHDGVHFLVPPVSLTEDKIFLNHPRGYFGGHHFSQEVMIAPCVAGSLFAVGLSHTKKPIPRGGMG